jgi:hypothetical protein
MEDDELIAKVYKKIQRERALINAASNMRQSTDNPQVQQSLDSSIRDGRKNIAYLEEKMRELQMRRMGSSGPPPPAHGTLSPQSQQMGNNGWPGGPTPPPKDQRGYGGDAGDYGDPGPGGYNQGGNGMMPPRAPYGPPGPTSTMPKARPNYSKLGAHELLYPLS